MSNFSNNHLALINVETNVVINFDFDNSSFNKNSYFSNDCGFSFNNNHHTINLNNNSNNKSNISSIISIKKYIQ